jgi:hypothetical protein
MSFILKILKISSSLILSPHNGLFKNYLKLYLLVRPIFLVSEAILIIFLVIIFLKIVVIKRIQK